MLSSVTTLAAVQYAALWLYGSQLRFLYTVNLARVASVELAKSFYDEAKEKDPVWYAAIRFDDWLGYMTKGNLLLRNDDGHLVLSEYGQLTIDWLSRHGTPHKPY